MALHSAFGVLYAFQTQLTPLFDCPPPNFHSFSYTKHFSTIALYADISAAFETLEERVPPIFAQSPPFQQLVVKQYSLTIGSSPVSVNWKHLAAHSSTSSPRSHILFVGAPVQCCEWIPLPDAYDPADEQYLAIVMKPSADFKLFVRRGSGPQRSQLQLWSLRGLPVSSQTESLDGPRLRYTVCIDDGPVLCVAIMPSGGYDSDSDGERLAVAAIPTFAGDVRLVGLPRPERIETNAIRLCGVALLLRSTENAGHVSRLCWSKTRDHQTIVAGYLSGTVVVWNLRGIGNPLLEDVSTENGERSLSFTHVLRPCTLMITRKSCVFIRSNCLVVLYKNRCLLKFPNRA